MLASSHVAAAEPGTRSPPVFGKPGVALADVDVLPWMCQLWAAGAIGCAGFASCEERPVSTPPDRPTGRTAGALARVLAGVAAVALLVVVAPAPASGGVG